MKKFCLLFLCSISVAHASIPQLYNLSATDVDAIAKEFSSNFVHTIVAPASSYGKFFGFEAGLMAGGTKTPNIDRISKSFDSNAKISMIPTAGLIGGVSAPFGFCGEINLIPKVTSNGVTFKNASAAFKWTMTDVIPDAPVNFSARVHGSSSELDYASIVNNASTANLPVATSVKWKTTTTGYNFSFSKKLLFIEPYVGFGSVSTKTNIGVNAATNVQIFTFTTASNYISNNNGSHYYGGVNLNLFLLKIGAEYAKIMGVTKVAGKLSFYF